MLTVIKTLLGIWVGIFAFATMKETEEADNSITSFPTGQAGFNSNVGQQTQTEYNPEYAPKADENISSKAQSAFQQKLTEYNVAGQNADELIEAKLFAQSVELLLLKAPASAAFSPLEDMNVVLQNGVYVVKGWVDSQNSYGAMIRTPFNISVMKINGEWKTVSKFIKTSTTIGVKMTGNLILYFIIGAILTAISYFIIKAIMGF